MKSKIEKLITRYQIANDELVNTKHFDSNYYDISGYNEDLYEWSEHSDYYKNSVFEALTKRVKAVEKMVEALTLISEAPLRYC